MKRIEIFFEGKKGVNASFDGYVLKTDQPVKDGGSGSAPTPFDIFLASLATCAGVFIKSFCENRNLPIDKIKIFQDIEYDKTTHLATKINLEIQVPEDFPENYRKALAIVAGKCKVKKQLLNLPEMNAFTMVKD